MPETNSVPCSICNGALWLEEIKEGEIASRRCPCLKRRMLLDFLGPELASAKHRKSPLFSPALDVETKRTIGDRTLDNLFIKGSWVEAAQHIRWAVAAKKHCASGFSFRMVNDEKLLRVYLGDFAYSRRSSRVRDEIETYNNLADLVSGHSLLVVRLGKLGYRNKAAADVLQETLNLRASESKPTWLVEGEIYFGEGHLFYNDEVGRYIEQNFDIINVGGEVREKPVLWAALTSSEAPVVEAQERFQAAPNALEEGGKQPFKRWRGRTGSGNGLPGAL